MRKIVLVSLDALYDADLAWLGEDSFMGDCCGKRRCLPG